mgnify:CR=1 FL=1
MDKAANRQITRFALAGKMVSKPAQARAIYLDAVRSRKDWLVPQARNVYILLKRAQAAAAQEGGAA